MKIEIKVLDDEGYVSWDREFQFMKEARAWIKECAFDAAYWERMAEPETPGWAARNIETIQLIKNGEVVEDWFPEFKS